MGFWNKQNVETSKHRIQHHVNNNGNNNKMMAHIKRNQRKETTNMKAYTPWKINMKPTHHPFRKETDFQTSMNIFFRGVALLIGRDFFGVNFQGSKVSESSWWSTPPKSCLIHPQLAAAVQNLLCHSIIRIFYRDRGILIGKKRIFILAYETYPHLEVGSIWNQPTRWFFFIAQVFWIPRNQPMKFPKVPRKPWSLSQEITNPCKMLAGWK